MRAPNTTTSASSKNRGPGFIGYAIFASRWLQAPLYLGLIIAQAIYVVVFMTELWHLGERVWNSFTHPNDAAYALNESGVMLAVLGLIDVVMIANLLIMVIIGGYETFVSRIHTENHPDQPEWLSQVNANVLKVKLAMAIIGISSIHLLKTFIEINDLGSPQAHTDVDAVYANGDTVYTTDGVMWQVIIHLTFIISALALALIDRMAYHKGHKHETHDGVHVPYSPAQDETTPASQLTTTK